MLQCLIAAWWVNSYLTIPYVTVVREYEWFIMLSNNQLVNNGLMRLSSDYSTMVGRGSIAVDKFHHCSVDDELLDSRRHSDQRSSLVIQLIGRERKRLATVRVILFGKNEQMTETAEEMSTMLRMMVRMPSCNRRPSSSVGGPKPTGHGCGIRVAQRSICWAPLVWTKPIWPWRSATANGQTSKSMVLSVVMRGLQDVRNHQ